MRKNERLCLDITILSVFIYGILMLYFYARTDALVPDEVWFFNIASSMQDYSLIDLFKSPNQLGYGSIYWTVLTLLRNIVAMRIFSWLCLMTIPVCIITIMRKALKYDWLNVLISILLLLSMPMAWFTGKIIGPELFGNALGAVAVTVVLVSSGCSLKQRYISYIIGGILIGVSTGIKTYNLIFGLFVGLYEIYPDCFNKDFAFKMKIKKILMKFILLFISSLFGFIVANPFILFDISLYVNVSGKTDWNIANRISRVLMDEWIEWDLVNSGGFCHVIMSFIGVLCLLGISIYRGGGV